MALSGGIFIAQQNNGENQAMKRSGEKRVRGEEASGRRESGGIGGGGAAAINGKNGGGGSSEISPAWRHQQA
jgi:hypothetical protein